MDKIPISPAIQYAIQYAQPIDEVITLINWSKEYSTEFTPEQLAGQYAESQANFIRVTPVVSMRDIQLQLDLLRDHNAHFNYPIALDHAFSLHDERNSIN